MNSDLYGWLRERGYTLKAREFPVLGKRADYVGLREKDNKSIAIEVKSYYLELLTAIGQCLYYKRGANFVYIAFPKKEVTKLSAVDKEILKSYGIGLLSINADVEVIFEAEEGILKEGVIEDLKTDIRQTTFTIYDEKGRTKFPERVLEWLGVGKGDKVFAIRMAEETAVKLVPLEKAASTIRWPRLEGINEDEALKKKTQAVYEAL